MTRNSSGQSTRKFGKKRFVLKWDSASFTTYRSRYSAASTAELRRIAKLWLKDYTNDDWQAKMTTYHDGKEFKVWVLPRGA